MLRKLWPIWFVVWVSLAGCKTAPKVNYCIPGEPEYGCANGPMPMQESEGMICTNTRHQRTILRACRLGVGISDDIVICVASDAGKQMACSDGQVLPAYGASETYTCLNQTDFDRLMIWCKRKAKGNP